MSRGRMLVLFVCLCLVPALMGAKPTSRLFRDAESVELFAAIQGGQLDVRLIPKDAKQATVLVKNLTKKPLRIQMPAAFVGMPVLAQDDFGDFGDSGGAGDSGGSQAMGGGMMGGMGGGMMGGMGGMGGGMFNVAPERTHKIKVKTVCLEHGKKDPNPRIAYQLKPIEAFTSDPRVKEVCRMLGRGEIDQVSAQAAAWHLTDDLSWQELARKIKIKHLNGRVEMFFTPRHLYRALKIVSVAKHRTESKRDSKSPGEASPGETKL